MERRAHSDRVETIPDCGDEEMGKFFVIYVVPFCLDIADLDLMIEASI
jgi:hypothetical protein